jgi:hypothetical protein
MSQNFSYAAMANPFEYFIPPTPSGGTSLENAKDPNGSRKLQTQIEKSTKEEYTAIFNELFPNFMELIYDPYGNYVIQKLLDFGALEFKEKILQIVKNQVLVLSTNAFACRVIQKLLETLSIEGQTLIYNEIKYFVSKMVDDTNANHVIQKCIERMPHSHIDYIVKYFINNVSSYIGI